VTAFCRREPVTLPYHSRKPDTQKPFRFSFPRPDDPRGWRKRTFLLHSSWHPTFCMWRLTVLSSPELIDVSYHPIRGMSRSFLHSFAFPRPLFDCQRAPNIHLYCIAYARMRGLTLPLTHSF
jgi:hypothetical protein